jgi:hypothetical protein
MSISAKNRRFPYLGTLATAATITLTAIALPLSPAKAQGWAGVQIGPFGFGISTPPVYAYPYYPYGYYYPRYYYPGYYYGY